MMGILLARGGSLLRLTDGNGGGKGLVAGKEMGETTPPQWPAGRDSGRSGKYKLATSPAPRIRMFLPQLPPSNHLCEIFSATYGISLFSNRSVDETCARARGRCRFDGSLPDRNMERNFTRK